MKDQLQELRRKNDLTQQQAADIFGIKVTTYQKYERDIISPSYTVLRKMADYFGVTTDYLLGTDLEGVSQPYSFMDQLSERDRETVTQYASLPEDVRRPISDMIMSVSERLKK